MLESRRPAAENVDLLGKVVPLGRIELVLQVSLRGPRKAGDKIEEVAWDIKIAEQTSWVPLSNMHLFVLVTFIVELACGCGRVEVTALCCRNAVVLLSNRHQLDSNSLTPIHPDAILESETV